MKPAERKASPAELGAAVFFLVAAVVLAGSLVRQRLSQRPASSGAMLIVPAVAQEGVVVTPGPGRLLFVDSTPEGAALSLDGSVRGVTPFSTDFVCQEGELTVLELDKPGYKLARFELACASGSTRVSVTLKRGR
jgi:hypothetical protein